MYRALAGHLSVSLELVKKHNLPLQLYEVVHGQQDLLP